MDLYGPPLPPGYIRPNDEKDNSKPKPSSKDDAPIIGPILPSHLQNSNVEDESLCGPSLQEFQEKSDTLSEMKADIDKKASKMKHKLDNKNVIEDKVEREEWMTVPDTSGRNQLGAISRCLAPSKSKTSGEKHSSHKSERDKKTTEELKKYNKSRRGESLMDAHSKKLKKKEKADKSRKKEERRAFDRDQMEVRLFTKEQVNSVIDKAKFLNSRFAASKNNKYL